MRREAREQGLLSRTALVAFPDDDCWYPEGALERILNLFRTDQGLDFWFCAYASTPSAPSRALSMDTKPPSVFNVAAKASSNTIFLRSPVVERVGRIRVIEAGRLLDQPFLDIVASRKRSAG